MIIRAGGYDYIFHIAYATLPDGTRTVRAKVHTADCFKPWAEEKNDECQTGGGVGLALCHPRDQYVKRTGRKIAMGRALRALEPSKDRRALVWAEYLRKIEGRLVLLVTPEEKQQLRRMGLA